MLNANIKPEYVTFLQYLYDTDDSYSWNSERVNMIGYIEQDMRGVASRVSGDMEGINGSEYYYSPDMILDIVSHASYARSSR